MWESCDHTRGRILREWKGVRERVLCTCRASAAPPRTMTRQEQGLQGLGATLWPTSPQTYRSVEYIVAHYGLQVGIVDTTGVRDAKNVSAHTRYRADEVQRAGWDRLTPQECGAEVVRDERKASRSSCVVTRVEQHPHSHARKASSLSLFLSLFTCDT